ncbi:MAG TPA: acetylornithine deacetylase [Solirubrobacteraceae bacterium]|nr:acetylornithine deacetylase [Solirubrobacteraceae bacterium]
MTDETPRRLLADLVGFATVAGTSNEALVAYAADRLDSAGATVTTSPATRPDGLNLHAVLGPADVPGVILSAHTDVVAVAGQAWSRDPFVLHAEDGRLYGRGTADMKGFIAAALAVAAGVRAGALRRPLHVVLSCDEELGCVGIRPLLPQLAGTVPPPHVCVVGEPTRLRVADRHKGKLALRVTVTGRACHSSRAPQGVNAVEYAARLIVGLGDVAGSGRDQRFAVPQATVSTGPIRGGVALNIVPDACVFEVEIRLLPGQDADRVQARLRAAAERLTAEMRERAPEAGIAVERTTAYPALVGGHNARVAREIALLAGAGYGLAVDFGTEAGLLQQALKGPAVVCGPGDMAQGHRPDEYLEQSQLDDAVAFLKRLAATLT